jgi:hypothetical protein
MMRPALRNAPGHEAQEPDQWVIGTWHCYYHVELLALARRNGRPWPEACATSSIHDMHCWNSYHAARKFQRSHPHLSGYVIVNLSAIQRQCWEQRRRKNAERHEPLSNGKETA